MKIVLEEKFHILYTMQLLNIVSTQEVGNHMRNVNHILFNVVRE
jgi:hypothetical protein